MRNKQSKKGIIFDMDNTLLRSHINFQAMKQEIVSYLTEKDMLPKSFCMQEHTTSTVIQFAKERGLSEHMFYEVMGIAARHELAGMEGAGLEPFVQPLLETLMGRYVLVIVTNNAYAAAQHVLELTEIAGYFDRVIGREQMEAMKPSPSGYLAAKKHFPHIQDREWISIGDSWIDGMASMEAGIPFISYGGEEEWMEKKGVKVVAHIDNILDLLDYL
ncbi:HAD family hydrolase [Paenibacillus sp. N3.4]|uniref:HAD family hydrolase n=1 Tax=Paenibacillus sp. N3.4 TaxID=2603222 RepID=UPI0011C80214|nr:HAD-IA family hydrolase [Paenibacillus sp. N3.4]TXK81864.1 HAD-IA family hydrolase [Paenibacillus sp. N3.4]